MPKMTDKANSPEEPLDIVNENDEVIGNATREEIHSDIANQPIHREVAVLIYDSKNRILMQQRSAAKKTHPLIWSISAAGHVLSGQKPEDTAKEELKEELGLAIPLTFVKKIRTTHTNERVFLYFYVGLYNDQTITAEPAEVEKIAFLTKKEVENAEQNGVKIGSISKNFCFWFWEDYLTNNES